MKILVTGANGMVAGAAIEYYQSIGDEVFPFTRQQLDIADKEQVFSAVEETKPDVIINCAAYTDVDGSETSVEQCYAVNAAGVENLALAAKRIDCGFVTISTDYVFDGANSGFYTQRDTPRPISVYGQAKLEGEIRARNAYARSIVVRSGWIYGAGGTNFLCVIHRLLAEGKTVKVINDAYGTPTFAKDLVRRLRELARLDLPCIFHVTNSGAGASYEDFARKICELKGFDTSLLESISAGALKRPAPRPQSSKLACLFSDRLGLPPLQNWEKALEEFLRTEN
ncbi:MAG: dTDP-4-dehydrorhamnose reductase [Acidobacteriota bacterium]|nr:dTDP-4-dehydrorhamnose reductase [Acidobacteriota bacterium]